MGGGRICPGNVCSSSSSREGAGVGVAGGDECLNQPCQRAAEQKLEAPECRLCPPPLLPNTFASVS